MNVLASIAPRIGALIRLLASPQDGEVVAAARALGRVLKGVNSDFHELAERIEKTTPVTVSNDAISAYWAQDSAIDLLDSGMALSARERDFLQRMKRWSGRPTERQAAWLRALVERSERRRA
jgi:hypothetical protein